ncbi:Hypothetical protein FKW44_022905 [Caligus rogercresseyi]|uniref:Uncharacterized protein n=1 Tax=Caligus rogercresseyi TaxID=217165 RepID=A0A7T8GNK5_CALRO|nr:Hypothetical protein FKW44_022905 [Caligus rogercresseyi]
MEGLQLFALWLEEKHPPLEQEAAVFHTTSEKENKRRRSSLLHHVLSKTAFFLGACVELKITEPLHAT